MKLGLDGQVAFVAGSSRGIGRAIAQALLDEGASVVLTGRDAAALEQTVREMANADTYERILPFAGDFAQAGAIASAMERTAEHFGRIDHMIANLGTGSGKPGWQQTEEEWARLFELNFFASVRLAQAAIPYLARQGGSLLFLASIVAVEATQAPLPYSAAKAALLNYAKNLSRLVAKEKVRVNTIAPGNIFFAGGTWEKHLETRRESVEAMLRTEVPQGRFGTPEEIASLAAFLCSERAGFATGSCFVVDGGQTRVV
jgi:3-oxoacyl-[acyl-carrier protein] reductase